MVFGCVCMCQYVFVCGCCWLCVVVGCVLLLVASVLASMRWLLCGGDGSKQKEKNDICNYRKMSRERSSFHYSLKINSKKVKPHQITVMTVFY